MATITQSEHRRLNMAATEAAKAAKRGFSLCLHKAWPLVLVHRKRGTEVHSVEGFDGIEFAKRMALATGGVVYRSEQVRSMAHGCVGLRSDDYAPWFDGRAA